MKDIHGPHKMNPNDFGDPLTFPHELSVFVFLSGKSLLDYWMDFYVEEPILLHFMCHYQVILLICPVLVCDQIPVKVIKAPMSLS